MERILKNQAISAAILKKISEGLTVAEAIDAVIGSGAHEKLAGELYDALRAQK